MSQKQTVIAYAFDKRGRLLATGRNRYDKTHPLQRLFAKHTSNPNRQCIHAELDALIRASKRGRVYSLHVERIMRDGSRGLAKPCDACQHALKVFDVQSVTWST